MKKRIATVGVTFALAAAAVPATGHNSVTDAACVNNQIQGTYAYSGFTAGQTAESYETMRVQGAPLSLTKTQTFVGSGSFTETMPGGPYYGTQTVTITSSVVQDGKTWSATKTKPVVCGDAPAPTPTPTPNPPEVVPPVVTPIPPVVVVPPEPPVQPTPNTAFQLRKYVTKFVVHQGRSFKYKIVLRNTGDSVLQNITLRDRLPEGVALQRVPRGATLVNGVITWKLPDIQPHHQRQRTISVIAASFINKKVCNRADVTILQPYPGGIEPIYGSRYVDHCTRIIVPFTPPPPAVAG